MLAVWQTDEPGLLMKEGKQSGGETPSRTESSCPAWRSHTIQALGDIPSGNDVSPPLTLALSRRGRGDCSPVQCAPLIGTLRLIPWWERRPSRCLVRHPLEC